MRAESAIAAPVWPVLAATDVFKGDFEVTSLPSLASKCQKVMCNTLPTHAGVLGGRIDALEALSKIDPLDPVFSSPFRLGVKMSPRAAGRRGLTHTHSTSVSIRLFASSGPRCEKPRAA